MQGFDTLTPPFDRLAHDEAEALRRRADIGYFRPGERIVARGAASPFLHVLLKGTVEARNGAALLAVLRAGDAFDARAVVHGEAGEDFVAAEETLCVLLPREDILALVHRNRAFGAFFYAEVSQKLDALSARPRAEIAGSVLATRIRDVRYGAAVFVDGAETIEAAAHRMVEADTDAVFVRDGDRTGVVTGLKLSRAVLIDRLPVGTPMRAIARFEIVALDADSRLVEALLLMTRSNRRRIAVTQDARIVGLLRDIDILGQFAGNSQLVPGRIARAATVDDLAAVAGDIAAQVERLHRQGVRVDAVADITSDLNHRLHARLFDLLAPPAIRESGCLFLMGSEGRGEQIVRTDQDNGLLLAAEPPPPGELDAFRAAYAEALERCGFPPCPGGIMVRNPLWSQPLDDFLAQIRRWIRTSTPEAAMNLAIFADAAAVAGDGLLVESAKADMVETLRGETRLLAQLALLTDVTPQPGIGLLDTVLTSLRLRPDRTDPKREGIFPIVHGVRVLSIEHGTLAGTTLRRIEALTGRGVLDPAFGRELSGALQVFMSLRLRAQLDAAQRGEAAPVEGGLDLAAMTTIERDVLRDALRVVGRFRELIGLRYGTGNV